MLAGAARAHAVTACELLAAYQAATLSGRQPPPGCQPIVHWLAGIDQCVVRLLRQLRPLVDCRCVRRDLRVGELAYGFAERFVLGGKSKGGLVKADVTDRIGDSF